MGFWRQATYISLGVLLGRSHHILIIPMKNILDAVYLLRCIDFLFAIYLLSYNAFTCKFFQAPLYSLAIRNISELLLLFSYTVNYQQDLKGVLRMCLFWREDHLYLGRWWGVLTYMGYMGMYYPKRYGFSGILIKNRA